MADEDIPTAVKLKVHYTFDYEQKNNHLCRPPQSFHVLTAVNEEGAHFGIIDLRQCLAAVTESSPELTNYAESDYTVYISDVSEVGTPFVGYGLLSKCLSQEAVNADDNEQMVSGKIVQSMMAKFKKNVEPVLEVKMKLTPIAPSFGRARSGSIGSSFDSTNFQVAPPSPLNRPHSPADMSRLENVQRMMTEGGPRRESSFHGQVPWNTVSRPSSRPGTPTQMQQFPPQQPCSNHSTNGGNFRSHQSGHQRRGSESGYWTADEAFEDGPAKKRAKIMKVQRATRESFNIDQQPNSLRTAAMGASSLRIHQPVAMNPAAALQRGMSTEEPVRPPTPMAHSRTRKDPAKGRRSAKSRTMESVEPSSPSKPQSYTFLPPISAGSSPEDSRQYAPPQRSFSATPANMPSSPPFVTQHTASPDLPSPPTSLQANTKLDNQDSGYFSNQPDMSQLGTEAAHEDGIFGDFEFNADIENYDFSPFLAETAHLVNQTEIPPESNHYTPVFDEESQYEGPTPQADSQQMPASTPAAEPQKIPTPVLRQTQDSARCQMDQFQRPPLPSQHNRKPASGDKVSRSTPTLLPRPAVMAPMQRSFSVLPAVPASDPGTGRQFQRSNTWTPDMSDIIMSDQVGAEDGKSKGRKRVGKEQTKARLESAIAAGNMPPFCYNCGVIETPAWRRAFIRVFDNKAFPYDDHPTSLEPGEMCYKAPDQVDKEGTIETWKGWKADKVADKNDPLFEQVSLCNPCGLWFQKSKFPRPEEKWRKKGPKEKKKRKRPPKPPKSRTQPLRSTTGALNSDLPESEANDPGSEESSPADTTGEDMADEINDAMTVDGEEDSNQSPELPPIPKSMSVQFGRRTVMFADINTRQTQSSPANKGSEMQPVELDLTPKPLRRVLFPSPGTPQANTSRPRIVSNGSDEEGLPSILRRSPRLNKTRDMFGAGAIAVATTIEVGSVVGKENITPQGRNEFDNFDDLFGDNNNIPAAPMTPTPKRRSERLLSKTPQSMRNSSREFGAAISGNAQTKIAAPKTPVSKYSADAFDIFLDTANRGLEPEQMTPFSKQLQAAMSGAVTPSSKHSHRTGFTPKFSTPGRRLNFDTDLPNLPSLHDSSPMSIGMAAAFLSEMPTDRLYSELDPMMNTDAPMPSSPPIIGTASQDFGNLGEIDVDVQSFDETTWGWFDQEQEDNQKTPRKQNSNNFLSVDTPRRAALRRSPRRAGRE